MQYWVIVGLILLLVVAVIFFIWLIYWKELATSAAGSDVCKISVLANVKTGGVINQNCKTIETTIKEDEEEEIKKEIAKMMYTCWDQFGQGGLDVFGRKTPVIKIIPTIGKIRCFVCYKFNVGKDISIADMVRSFPSHGQPIVDPKWFKENTYLKNRNYHDFFTQKDGQYYVQEGKLKEGADYAILFREVEGILEFGSISQDIQTVELRRFDELNEIPCETYE